MGLFDYLRCECQLPDLEDPTSIEFQTKSLVHWLEQYRITAAGRLERQTYHVECLPKSTVGPMEPYVTTVRIPTGWEDVGFHGILIFYRWLPDTLGPHEWIEYEAKFTDGALVSVRRLEEK